MDGCIRVVDALTGNLLLSFQGHGSSVDHMAFDGTHIASTSSDRSATFACLCRCPAVHRFPVVFRPLSAAGRPAVHHLLSVICCPSFVSSCPPTSVVQYPSSVVRRPTSIKNFHHISTARLPTVKMTTGI